MQVQRLAWLGTRTDQYAETVSFFEEVLGLRRIAAETGFVVLEAPDGATVEIFGPDSEFNAHLTSPVAGFQVEDIEKAVEELGGAGVEIVLPITGAAPRRWMNFRSPDGHLYALFEDQERPAFPVTSSRA